MTGVDETGAIAILPDMENQSEIISTLKAKNREAAVQAYQQGVSANKIAKTLNVSSETVRNWVRDAGHSVRPVPTAKVEWAAEAAELHLKKGMSLSKIIRKLNLNVSRQRVSKVIREHVKRGSNESRREAGKDIH